MTQPTDNQPYVTIRLTGAQFDDLFLSIPEEARIMVTQSLVDKFSQRWVKGIISEQTAKSLRSQFQSDLNSEIRSILKSRWESWYAELSLPDNLVKAIRNKVNDLIGAHIDTLIATRIAEEGRKTREHLTGEFLQSKIEAEVDRYFQKTIREVVTSETAR